MLLVLLVVLLLLLVLVLVLVLVLLLLVVLLLVVVVLRLRVMPCFTVLLLVCRISVTPNIMTWDTVRLHRSIRPCNCVRRHEGPARGWWQRAHSGRITSKDFMASIWVTPGHKATASSGSGVAAGVVAAANAARGAWAVTNTVACGAMGVCVPYSHGGLRDVAVELAVEQAPNSCTHPPSLIPQGLAPSTGPMEEASSPFVAVVAANQRLVFS